MIARNILLSFLLGTAGAAVCHAQETQAREQYMNMDRAEYREMLRGQGKSDEQIEKALAEYDRRKAAEKKKQQKKAMVHEGSGEQGASGRQFHEKKQAREMNREQNREMRQERSVGEAQEKRQLKPNGSFQGQAEGGGKKAGAMNQDRKMLKSGEGLAGNDGSGPDGGQKMAMEQRQQMEQARAMLKDMPPEQREQARRMLDAAEKAMSGEGGGDGAESAGKGSRQPGSGPGQGGANNQTQTQSQARVQAQSHSQGQFQGQANTQTQSQTQTRTQAGPGAGAGRGR